ncbi:hypothetical protein [Pleurocapsa sp. FMAR1]|uniref:hypothetical protein n=1 Tax=Pleurocapsa sp. FMAR1 TaxID=3040204 RepID=UPI0029C764A7|nr:hypothetical protein [Pleurocapsa sp. FMAR1]
MRKLTLTLAIITSILTYSQKCLANDFQELISGKQAPLTRQLKDLNDSWRQVAISGQYEMADLMKSWTSIFGADIYNNIYYTQGKTVKVNDETYVIAYRLASSGKSLTITSLLKNVMGSVAGLTGTDCDSIGSPEKITPETTIALSLLNLKTIGSLNNVRPFDLEKDLAMLEQAEQESKAACEQAKSEAVNLVESNLQELGSALQSYTDQNGGKLPDMSSLETVKLALQDFVYDESVFYHPVTLEPYQVNAFLSAQNLDDLDNAMEIVAFYEANPAADGTVGVVYADGFYQRIQPEDWEAVKQASKLP